MTSTTHRATGTPLARIEGPQKVAGTALYAAEYPVRDVAHAWVVRSPVAKGTLTDVVVDPLTEADDVLAVLWHGNAPRLNEADDPELHVLQSDRISYRGQAVALVVARTLEAARRAAQVLRLDIATEPHDAELTADHPDLYTPETVNPGFPAETTDGDVDTALAAAAVTVDVTYSTPALHNNPMEPHATIARWDGDDLVLYDSNQGASVVAQDLGPIFDCRVHVIAEHIGGGFGSKGSARPNAVLAAMAAKVVGRPVKLALPRQALFSMVGYRTPTIQRIRLGADRDGTLTAIDHVAVEQSSRLFEFAEQTTVCTRHMYAAPNRHTSHRMLRLDMPTPRWMRAPGEAPGMVGLECAMDELAEKLGVDPVELRLRNEPSVDPDSGTPFTSRHFTACLREGAARFGWEGRDPRPRRRREGNWWIGTGVAGALYPAMVQPSAARARRLDDGRFEVAIAATDLGTGARTVLTQIAADALGCPVSHVTLRIGDSTLPQGSVAGGSSGTSSWGWAVTRACGALLDGTAPEAVYDTTDDVSELQTEGKHAFGAHFAEVRVDADTGEVRVSRLFGMYAAGRIINPRTARSQLIGGMTMGMGMALHEEGVLDPAMGDWVNHDLAGYHVPAHADVEWIDAAWLDEEDDQLNPMGTKGIGEIGIVGSPAAIVNAVWHATGVRVRDLPVRLDRLLPHLA
jgi:xanthine dehydrogenase YagR molybdenum-binding subunit